MAGMLAYTLIKFFVMLPLAMDCWPCAYPRSLEPAEAVLHCSYTHARARMTAALHHSLLCGNILEPLRCEHRIGTDTAEMRHREAQASVDSRCGLEEEAAVKQSQHTK